ncbi:MAG: PASTA domain-containing protein, partial [Helcococcus sp.]|nr:PASTA domain-containing protein [Helcococcus sp.]
YHIISSQYPTTNNSIEINSVIKLETNNSISMPNLVGMDLYEARNILEDNYIKYSINGEGKKIIKQSANPNDIINIEEEITINLGE